ncbi:DUF4123 domain-containing protein [Zymobacter sp. IVIA_12111.31 C1]|uniref:DUF4123 domain-containing protein n=1 Tax=Zymobacter sp. IVIA_12111.31 C1 TaxID=3394854 RepID=UPI0039C014EA
MAHYLLLDPSTFDPQSLTTPAIEQQQQRDADSIATIDNPAIPAIVAEQLRLQPCVQGSVLWQESHEWADALSEDYRPCISGWLDADLSTQALAMALRANMVQPIPNGRRALIRLYDPRVLQHLHVLLGEEQLAALISPVTRWTYSDWNHDLQTIEIKAPRRQVNLTEEQWASIKRFDATSHVVSVWRDMRAESERKVPHDASVKADRQVANALNYGLETQMDVTAYALCGLAYREDFDQIPEVQRMLQQCGQGTPFMYFIDTIQNDFLM